MKIKNKGLIICLVICILLISICIIGGHLTKSNNEENDPDTETVYEDDTDEEETAQHIENVPEGYIGIYNVDDFEYIRTNSHYNYILMNDIDFSGVKDWSSVNIDGIFNGNNYTISNLTSNCELFGNVIGELTDLSVVNAKIKSASDTGGLCTSLHPQTDNGDLVGNGIIKNCHISADISVNIEDLFPEYSELNSSVKSSVNIGGIAGSIKKLNDYEPKIENCSFDGNIKVICDYSKRENQIGDSLEVRVGGIAGNYQANTMQDCETKGSIEVKKLNQSGTIEHTVIAIGGISGRATGSINWAKSSMKITSNFDQVSAGGIVGETGNITTCGVFSCYNVGNINLSYGSSVEFAGTHAGGICGNGFSDIINCYNLGSISAEDAGGLSGDICSTKTSYNAGKVTGKLNVGTISAKKCDTIEYCYYLESGLPITGEGGKYPYSKALSSDEMKSKDSFAGFDFENVWQTSDGKNPYPTLIYRP